MDEINAKSMNKLAIETDKELLDVLKKIKEEATNGKYVLNLKDIKRTTLFTVG